MVNVFEQLAAEWYEFKGYFVRRNVRVGKRPAGGWEGELDIVAFHPGEQRLIHVEASGDAESWQEREQRFFKKFETGKKYIPTLFLGFQLPADIEQIALIGFGSAPGRDRVGGAQLVTLGSFINEIRDDLKSRPITKVAVPEQFYLLRTLQLAAHHWFRG